MSIVVPIPDAASAGVAVVGGKGASLGELARAGVAVPPGFVVTVEAFALAMAALDPDGALRAELSSLPAGDLAGIATEAARFRALVAGADLPPAVAAAIAGGYAALGGRAIDVDVAVRSSATVEDSAEASFAGLQDTYLGVHGEASVLDSVRRCWASLYNDESLTYRRRLGMSESDVSMAVVVQRMVAPRAAGVMFTRSPVTGDRSVVAIEGVWGLGSALVSGDVSPDSWVISKITGEITTRRVSPKTKIHSYRPNGPAVPSPGLVTVTDTPPELRETACLTDDEIRALAELGRRVETHYGVPQDIEWAVLEGPAGVGSADSERSARSARPADAGHADAGPADAGPADAGPADAGERIVLLQSRPETVWAARASAPAGAPKPRAADHVLALFGKPL